jgi:4-hydroxybenzoate polyprenyltransferase
MALTLVFLRFFYFETNLNISGIELYSTNVQFTFMVLSVMLAAAAGYVINDFFDVEADLINKPEKVVVEKDLSKKKTLLLYGVLVLLSIGSVIASVHSSILPVIITVFFNFVLFVYAVKLKSLPFIGNVAVALIIAFVPAYALLYDIPITLYNINPETYEGASKELFQTRFNEFIFFFMEMAFFINLTREITKDIIDMDGDSSIKIKSLPIILGVTKTTYLIIGLLVVLIAVIWFNPIFDGRLLSKIYFIVGAFSMIIIAIILLYKQKHKQASLSLKIAMFIGLMYLPLFHFIFHHHDA